MATLAIAQESATKVLTANNVVSASSSFEATKGTENFINFEVEAMEAGDYYAEFWLLPAEYADGSFTTFKVYVNFKYVGSITTDRGNWQTAAVDDLPALKLNSGKNYISVSTEAPECPQVETVRLSKSAQAAKISSAEYDAYLEKAINSDGTPETVASITPMSTSNGVNPVVVNNVPLKYSFYKTFNFEKDQEIFISSSSELPHNIDMFFYGKEIRPVVVGPRFNPLDSIDFPLVDLYPDDGETTPGIILIFPASSDEIQGLNWQGVSQKSENNQNIHVATIKLTIPKTGIYMIKLRTADNLVMGKADLNVNGTYFYKSAPMYYARIECEMPADGKYYAAYAKSCNPDVLDPMLFVESKANRNIVGYNDNHLSLVGNGASRFDLSKKDSYLYQTYKFPTKFIHISSAKALITLNSQCTVGGGFSDEYDVFYSPAKSDLQGKDNSSIAFDNTLSITPQAPNLSTPIKISAKERINKVETYTLSGTKIAEHNINNYSATIPLQELGINCGGMYIISVETENGQVSQKMLVK